MLSGDRTSKCWYLRCLSICQMNTHIAVEAYLNTFCETSQAQLATCVLIHRLPLLHKMYLEKVVWTQQVASSLILFLHNPGRVIRLSNSEMIGSSPCGWAGTAPPGSQILVPCCFYRIFGVDEQDDFMWPAVWSRLEKVLYGYNSKEKKITVFGQKLG